MPIKQADTKELVPEALRDAAIEGKDGKWHYEETDPALTDAGKRALQEERDARKAEEKRRKDVERERDELKRTAEAKAAGISEAELTRMREAEAAARKPIEDELTATKAENRKLKLTDRVQALALKHGVMQDRIKQAMRILDERTDLTDTGGIVVKDEEGKVTTETIDDFLSKTFKKESPWFYKGTGSSGSGAAGSEGGGEEPKPKPKDEQVAQKRAQVAGSF